MNVNYIRINPSGNITLLVTDPVPREMQSGVARRLMQRDPGAEQVGFLEKAALPSARLRLQMMGGEFCGNATMSAAAYIAQCDGLSDGEAAVYPLEVSGAADVISCRIERKGDAFIGTVPMPLPGEITEGKVLPELTAPLVRFDGIDHFIVPEEKMTAARADQVIAPLCAKLGADALGILLLNMEKGSMRPLVYVRSTDSAVWENSCGSGTAAVGAWQAFVQKGHVCMEVRQPYPDTCIAVSAGFGNGGVRSLAITGGVRIEQEYRF